MFLVVARDRKFALALVTTAFFIIWIKLSNSWILFYSSAKINGRKPSRNYLNIVGLAKAPIRLYTNKIDYRYLKCTSHSNTDSCWCWKISWNWLKMLLAKAWSFLRFFQKKFLNFSYVIGSSNLNQRFCWYYSWTIALQRNKAANGIRFCLLALAE